MSQNTALETLVKERQRLFAEQKVAEARFEEQISDLDTAIMQLSGKKVWEVQAELTYDDTNADYIRSSQEEI